ncbi:MAG: VTT domain-containing protein [Verrucomicrobia bacterium]|nr:VTT domain-containing protein [Verrucomicrobiota bacterium]
MKHSVVRLFWIFLGLAILFLIPFLIWGDAMEVAFSIDGASHWLKGFEQWAWAAGVGLLFLDFILPIPGTAVMSALGFVYGPVIGGLIASSGSFFAGVAAYAACRLLGPGVAKKLLGEKDYHRGMTLFADAGGWIVVLSRWLPLLPEVVACMAGLTRMPLSKFLLAMACGSLPLGFVFAYIGSTGSANPLMAIVLSAGIPPILWLFAQYFLRKRTG